LLKNTIKKKSFAGRIDDGNSQLTQKEDYDLRLYRNKDVRGKVFFSILENFIDLKIFVIHTRESW
jgi:hypothetical protein